MVYILFPGLLLCLFASCSTTSGLPDGEQLYIGVDKIGYSTDMPRKPKKPKKQARNDSTGVITSVSNAIKMVNAAIEGRTIAERRYARIDTMSKEELKEYKEHKKQQRIDFATAKTEVDAVLNYAPNDALMGSATRRSPLHMGLWAYNRYVNDSTKFGKWMFKTFSTQPVLLSSVSPETRAKVATNTLHNYGYFRGRVRSRIVEQKNPKKAKVAYFVRTGRLFRLDSIEYRNFPISIDTLIHKGRQPAKLKKGEGFSVINLTGEQTRISERLRRQGYYYFSPSFINYQADTVQRKGYVQLRVLLDEKTPARALHSWNIGHIYIDMRSTPGEVLKKDLALPEEGINMRYNMHHAPLRLTAWQHVLFLKAGKRYSLMDETRSLQKIAEMGVFSQTDMAFVPRDTTETCRTLDLYINAVLDKPFDSSLEMNATIKSNSQVGPGLSYALSKRNAFRGGEKVSFKIFGSYEWEFGSKARKGNSLLDSYELGTNLSLEYPRFLFPFLSRRHFTFPATTTFSLQADWLNRSGFYQMITYSATANYSWRKTRTVRHELNIGLDFDKRLSTTAAFDSILTVNPVLEVSMRNQFVPSVGYTFTYNSPRSKRNPLYVQLGIKEAGNLVSLFYKTRGDKLDEQGKQLFDNPFAQFIKFTAEAHYTKRLSAKTQLATRLFAGAVFSYGNALRAPYSEQFYVGGANSVRGFSVRKIGPGSFRSRDTRYSYVDQTGDIKLEANAELRTRLLGSLYGALFLDAGNVWLTRSDELRPDATLTFSRLKNLAVGTGAGLRYDLEFLVLRLDLGVALHAPYDTGKAGWFNMRKVSDALALHFAIGYPF